MTVAGVLYYVDLSLDIVYLLYLCFHVYYSVIGDCLSPLDHSSSSASKIKIGRLIAVFYIIAVIFTIVAFFIPASSFYYVKLTQKIFVNLGLILIAAYYFKNDDDFEKKFVPFHLLYTVTVVTVVVECYYFHYYGGIW